MKKSTLFSAVAALALAGPLVVGAASAQQGQRERPPQDQQQYGERARPQNPDARNDDRRDHRDRRESWRDGRDQARWDERQHNGYYMNNRWTYGEPAANAYGRPGFSLGYRPWSVGQILGYYSTRFQPVDYRREQLRRPPRGLRWVRDDRGDYLLVNRSGRIIQVVVSGYEPRDRRQSWRDARNDARWDQNRHNGYYRDSQWTYGPPPEGRYGQNEIVYGYQPWQRGQRLGYYQGRYQEVDYRSNRSLRRPPAGYHWVRSDGGDLLLAAIVGGLITAVILNNTR
jgi:Ni/Co efflux regulator RcnB